MVFPDFIADGKWSWTGGIENLQLNIVGFLAVLGEGAVLATSQVSSLTWLCYVPRLLPAPQALLPPNRPRELQLPTTRASVTGVFNGKIKDHLNYFTQLSLYVIFSVPQTRKRSLKRCRRGRDLRPSEVCCVQVEYSPEKLKSGKGKTPSDKKNSTKSRSNTDMLESGLMASAKPRLNITPRVLGPVFWVTVLGSGFSVGLLVLSAVYSDAMSFSATVCLSLLSTIAGVANRCELRPPKRVKSPVVSRLRARGIRKPVVGDTVIRYPNNSFIVVKCEEDVAHELFFAPQEFEYHVDHMHYRLLSFLGTIILMLGIIFLANATLPLQIGWAIAYGLINTAYWVVAALAPRRHWDFSAYTLHEMGLASRELNDRNPESQDSLPLALWQAVVLTKTTDWVHRSNAAPNTTAWVAWINWAHEHVHKIKPTYRDGPLGHPLYDSAPDWVPKIWNDDVNGMQPCEKLKALEHEMSPVLNDDGIPPAPSPV